MGDLMSLFDVIFSRTCEVHGYWLPTLFTGAEFLITNSLSKLQD